MHNFGTGAMPLKPLVWEPIDVDNLLDDMKLDRDGLLHAVRYAEHERSFVTINDPIGFASYIVYAKSGRALREQYLPKGWVKDDSHNQVGIKHPETRVRIVPCNFNEFAGNRFKNPTNKSPKGEVSKNKSACNLTFWLPGLEPPPIEPELNDGYQTWLLGIHISDEHSVGAELSLPIKFDGRQFTKFGTRIILISGNDEQAVAKRRGSDDDAVGVVDIAIKRK
jgi:hypothetical protein